MLEIPKEFQCIQLVQLSGASPGGEARVGL